MEKVRQANGVLEDKKMAEEKEVSTNKENQTSNDVDELEVDNDDEFEFDEEDSSDGSREQDSNEEETSKKQSKSENHKYAEMRRAKEQKEREEKALEDSYKRGLMEGVGGINPYTNEKIVDDDDIEELQNMREIEKRGGNPIDDYSKYMKIFKREKLQQEAEANKSIIEQQNNVDKGINDFNEKYPDVDLKELLKNPKFKLFSEYSLNHGMPLVDAFEAFNEYNEKLKAEAKVNAEKKAKRELAKTISSPGSLTNNGKEIQNKSFKSMSYEELKEFKRKSGLI